MNEDKIVAAMVETLDTLSKYATQLQKDGIPPFVAIKSVGIGVQGATMLFCNIEKALGLDEKTIGAKLDAALKAKAAEIEKACRDAFGDDDPPPCGYDPFKPPSLN